MVESSNFILHGVQVAENITQLHVRRIDVLLARVLLILCIHHLTDTLAALDLNSHWVLPCISLIDIDSQILLDLVQDLQDFGLSLLDVGEHAFGVLLAVGNDWFKLSEIADDFVIFPTVGVKICHFLALESQFIVVVFEQSLPLIHVLIRSLVGLLVLVEYPLLPQIQGGLGFLIAWILNCPIPYHLGFLHALADGLGHRIYRICSSRSGGGRSSSWGGLVAEHGESLSGPCCVRGCGLVLIEQRIGLGCSWGWGCCGWGCQCWGCSSWGCSCWGCQCWGCSCWVGEQWSVCFVGCCTYCCWSGGCCCSWLLIVVAEHGY